jgi:glycosyltransferase involved in cell wall biosynthesis
MKIKIQQFLFNQNHSWSHVGKSIGRALLNLGHDVDFLSTDGVDDKYVPQDLKDHIITDVKRMYDCQISYTAPHNWPLYLRFGNKNRFAIWNYEYNSKQLVKTPLLEGFGKYFRDTDKVLPSSNFTKEVFSNMGIPNEKMVVVPHGINLEDYKTDKKWPLKTKKGTKILLNIAQPHLRKAIDLALESFGKAFTKNDDVCLIAKIFTKNKSQHQFDVDFNKLYKTFEIKFPNHADVEFVYDYVPNIAELYKSCDINFSATHAECWHLPSLEAISSGIINIAPRYGGLLDFCSDNNSLLIEGRVVRADRATQYWKFNPYAVHFVIDTNDAANKLRQAYNNKTSLIKQFSSSMIETSLKFTWNLAAEKIISLCS